MGREGVGAKASELSRGAGRWRGCAGPWLAARCAEAMERMFLARPEGGVGGKGFRVGLG